LTADFSVPLIQYPIVTLIKLSSSTNLYFTVVAENNTQVWRGATMTEAVDSGTIEDINWHIVKSVRIKGLLCGILPTEKSYKDRLERGA